MLGEGAGVDVVDAEHFVFGQIVVEALGGAPIGRDAAELADDETTHLNLIRFRILGIDAVVPDLGIGHGHDLSSVGGIGQNFLITGHGGVKTNLAGGGAIVSKGGSLESPPVFKCQKSFFAHRGGSFEQWKASWRVLFRADLKRVLFPSTE